MSTRAAAASTLMVSLLTIASSARAEDPSVSPPPSNIPSLAPTEAIQQTAADTNSGPAPAAAAESTNPGVQPELKPVEVFEKIEFATDERGHPIPQTIRLNEKVIEKDGERNSGFWFRLDRTEAASKQNVGDRGKMALYWYFLPPKPMVDWGMLPVTGHLHGFDNFCPLKLGRFKQLRDVPPMDKDRVIVQTLAANQLKEGKEYFIEFGFPLKDKQPVEMTFCLGFRVSFWDGKRWNGVNKAVDFLGLEHKGIISRADEFHR